MPVIPPRILKHARVQPTDALEAARLSAAPEALLRIPGERVFLDAPGTAADAAAPLPRLVRGPHTREAPAPIPLEEALVADFPLPPEVADALEARVPPLPAPAIDLEALALAAEQRGTEHGHAEGFAQGHAEGHDAGYAAGYAAARAELEAEFHTAHAAQLADMARLFDQLATRWEAFLHQSEPALVRLALDTAEALVNGPLPEALQTASREALVATLDRLATDLPVTVQLHPVDYLQLQETGLATQLQATHPTLRWLPTPTSAEGDWSVETDESVVRHHRTALLDSLRAKLE